MATYFFAPISIARFIAIFLILKFDSMKYLEYNVQGNIITAFIVLILINLDFS